MLDGKRLAGILTRSAAVRAVQEGTRDIARHVQDMASVPATAGLDEVLARLLSSTEPLAVTGDDDEFLGMLSRSKVVELVTPAIEGVAPVSNDETAEAVESPDGSLEDAGRSVA